MLRHDKERQAVCVRDMRAKGERAYGDADDTAVVYVVSPEKAARFGDRLVITKAEALADL